VRERCASLPNWSTHQRRFVGSILRSSTLRQYHQRGPREAASPSEESGRRRHHRMADARRLSHSPRGGAIRQIVGVGAQGVRRRRRRVRLMRRTLRASAITPRDERARESVEHNFQGDHVPLDWAGGMSDSRSSGVRAVQTCRRLAQKCARRRRGENSMSQRRTRCKRSRCMRCGECCRPCRDALCARSVPARSL